MKLTDAGNSNVDRKSWRAVRRTCGIGKLAWKCLMVVFNT